MGWGMDMLRKGEELAPGAGKGRLKQYGSAMKSHFKIATPLTGLVWGAMAVTSLDPNANMEETFSHMGKYAAAGIADFAVDTAITGTMLAPLATMGPIGSAIGMIGIGGLIATSLLGVDAGMLTLNTIEHMDRTYDNLTKKRGMNFEMSQGTSRALQRQIANLRASGSNIAEILHS